VVYLATATAGDEEMARRIEAHRRRRPAQWITVEEPLRLADALLAHGREDRCLLVECLTLWLANLLLGSEMEALVREREALLAALPGLAGQLILVSNETGFGVIPAGALSRRFCDEAGALHQRLAVLCDRVILTVAGLPLVLKGAVP
jgi:adenosylcobinamide kinase/adenosylcobinamide-phosphate guanylyltransferase